MIMFKKFHEFIMMVRNTSSPARVEREGEHHLEAIVADPEAAARDLTQVQRTEALVGLARMVRDLRSELEVKDGINKGDAAGSKSASPCEFDRLFTRDVPHILEGIFNLLDYDTFMTCRNVCKAWNELLSSEPYQKIAENLLRKKRGRAWLDCDVVGCPFWTNKGERMERHTMFHLNKLSKDLTCPDCGVKYCSLTKMLKHDRLEHTGADDYECRICGLEVTETIHLHVLKVHGLGPFRSLKALSWSLRQLSLEVYSK